MKECQRKTYPQGMKTSNQKQLEVEPWHNIITNYTCISNRTCICNRKTSFRLPWQLWKLINVSSNTSSSVYVCIHQNLNLYLENFWSYSKDTTSYLQLYLYRSQRKMCTWLQWQLCDKCKPLPQMHMIVSTKKPLKGELLVHTKITWL